MLNYPDTFNETHGEKLQKTIRVFKNRILTASDYIIVYIIKYSFIIPLSLQVYYGVQMFKNV